MRAIPFRKNRKTMRPARAMFVTFCVAANICATSCAAEFSSRDANAPNDAIDDLRREWLDRVEEARERYEAFVASVRLSIDVADRASSRTSHLHDATLREGDIVVTATGLLRFKGSQKFPHGSRDFERVGEWRARSLPHRRALLDVLRAAERGEP